MCSLFYCISPSLRFIEVDAGDGNGMVKCGFVRDRQEVQIFEFSVQSLRLVYVYLRTR
jgi:hypothetical protein